MPPSEPTLAALPNPLLRYFLATRPAFLSVTLASCCIGLATAYNSGVHLAPALAFMTTLFALFAHAGVNVLNDYYDALNGTDSINIQRIFPFTGGSRFIQNGVLTPAQTVVFGFTLFGFVVLAGLWLTIHSGVGLLAIGATGLFIGWAYSAEPLKLNSRGLGEMCVAIGFVLIAIGTDYVQRKAFSAQPFFASLSYGLLVTNLLYINQFPDRQADAVAGKHHWVVRLPVNQAVWGYFLIGVGAYFWLMFAVTMGWLPFVALIAMLPLALTLKAGVVLRRNAGFPSHLVLAIKSTILAALAHGALLTLALLVAKKYQAGS